MGKDVRNRLAVVHADIVGLGRGTPVELDDRRSLVRFVDCPPALQSTHRGNEQGVDLSGQEPGHRISFPSHVIGSVSEEQPEPLMGEGIFQSFCQRGEEQVGDVGDHEADGLS